MDSYAPRRDKIWTQSEVYRACRERTLTQEGVLHVHSDLSEKSSSKYDEETQSVHFTGQRQISLRTGVLHQGNRVVTFCVGLA